MNIAIILKKLSVQGGVQREALHLAIELQAMGDEVTVYAVHYEKGKGFNDLIDRVSVVALVRQRKARGITRLLPSFVGDLLQESRDAHDLARLIDPKTELLNPHHDPVTYKTAYYFKKYIRRIPSVWLMNDFNTKFSSFLRSRELGGSTRLSLLRRLSYWLFDTYERLRFINAQDIVTVLDYRDRELARRFLKRDAMIARHGVDISTFPFVRHLAPTRRKVRILMIGIFFSHRRFEDGIEAVRILKKSGIDCTLTIIGDPTTDRAYGDAMNRLTRRHHLDRVVTFRGRVADKDLLRAYADHDIFLFPSHLQSWGLAVFEAMASGIPVIVSKTAGAAEILTDKENALIVDPKNPSQIASAVTELVDNPALYEALSQQGRAFVEEKVSWEQYARRMREIFECAKKVKKFL